MQNLKCDICGKYLPLCRGDVLVNADYFENNHCYKIGYRNVPLFHCTECNESYLPEMTELFFRECQNISVMPLCNTILDTGEIKWEDFTKFEIFLKIGLMKVIFHQTWSVSFSIQLIIFLLMV
jgi:hypothetical protein